MIQWHFRKAQLDLAILLFGSCPMHDLVTGWAQKCHEKNQYNTFLLLPKTTFSKIIIMVVENSCMTNQSNLQ